jgi:gliding motility-associated-like protein
LANPADESVISCVLTPNLTCKTGPVASSGTITLTVNPTPVINFNPDTLVILPGGSVTLNPTLSGTVSGYQWSPSSYLNSAVTAGPVASPPQTTQYQLTVKGADGCIATGKETVLLYYHFTMPNAFTPNGDGVNDVFRIPSTGPQEIGRFMVYNRWGNCIFSTADAKVGWDGTSGGRAQPAGAYAWKVTYLDLSTGKWAAAEGTVMLMR